MSVVNLPSQKLTAWHKLRIEGRIRKYPEAQSVAEPQINTLSAVVEAASISVSQAKILFLQGANTSMKMNGAIAGDSATGRKKITTMQWAALTEFCGFETRKQV